MTTDWGAVLMFEKKMKTITLLLITLSVSMNAEVLYGTFQFTFNIHDNTSGLPAPEPVEETAFFIFDTDTQSLKVFNFIEEYLSSETFSHDFHQYQVSRHSGDLPITTISELTDFSVVQWRQYAEIELYPGWPHYVEIITDTVGGLSYHQPGGLGQAGPSGDGEIVSFSLNQREVGNEESWSFQPESERIWFKLNTKVGYKYEIFEGTSPASLSPRNLASWRNQSEDGKLIGTGEDWIAVNTSEQSAFFMKAISYPIEITD